MKIIEAATEAELGYPGAREAATYSPAIQEYND